MGFNGDFLLVCADRAEIVAQLPEVISRFFEHQGAQRLGNDRPLDAEALRADHHLFGVAISPPVRRGLDRDWISVADTEMQPSADLAHFVAEQLTTPVVLSSIWEICDPPVPELVRVFGAVPSDRFSGLYYHVGFRYRDLANPAEHCFFTAGEEGSTPPAPPFDPGDVVFLAWRAPSPLHGRSVVHPASGDDDIAF